MKFVPDRRPDSITAVSLHCPKCHGSSVEFVTFLRSLCLAGNRDKVCPRCVGPDARPAPIEPA